MLTDYVSAALRRAQYEVLPDDEGIYAYIVDLPGVWANGDTVEETREDLRLAVEGWIALALSRGKSIPVLDGVGVRIVALA